MLFGNIIGVEVFRVSPGTAAAAPTRGLLLLFQLRLFLQLGLFFRLPLQLCQLLFRIRQHGAVRNLLLFLLRKRIICLTRLPNRIAALLCDASQRADSLFRFFHPPAAFLLLPESLLGPLQSGIIGYPRLRFGGQLLIKPARREEGFFAGLSRLADPIDLADDLLHLLPQCFILHRELYPAAHGGSVILDGNKGIPFAGRPDDARRAGRILPADGCYRIIRAVEREPCGSRVFRLYFQHELPFLADIERFLHLRQNNALRRGARLRRGRADDNQQP